MRWLLLSTVGSLSMKLEPAAGFSFFHPLTSWFCHSAWTRIISDVHGTDNCVFCMISWVSFHRITLHCFIAHLGLTERTESIQTGNIRDWQGSCTAQIEEDKPEHQWYPVTVWGHVGEVTDLKILKDNHSVFTLLASAAVPPDYRAASPLPTSHIFIIFILRTNYPNCNMSLIFSTGSFSFVLAFSLSISHYCYLYFLFSLTDWMSY